MKYAILAAGLLWSACAPAAGFDDMAKEWREAQLLKGRLLASVPKAAVVAPQGSGDREVRVLLEAGDARLVVVVSELFRVAPAEFAQPAAAYLDDLGRRLKLGKLAPAQAARRADGMQAIEFTPGGKANVRDAVLVSGLVLRQKDGTVQTVAFFLNEAGIAQAATASPLIRRIADSVKPGKRALLTGKRQRVPGSGFTLDLPAGFPAYTQSGSDHQIGWVEHLGPLERESGRMGIYNGPQPQGSSAPASAKREEVKLFGTPAPWLEWDSPEKDGRAAVFFAEAFVKRDKGTLHVFITAVSAEERAAFRKIAESATLP